MTNTYNITKRNLLAAIAATAMMAIVSIPTIDQVRQRAETAICSAHLKGCVQGYNIYGQVHDDKWLAVWDKTNAGNPTTRQGPYIIWYYIYGGLLPQGPVCNELGWWDPIEGRYGGFSPMDYRLANPHTNPMYHCPTVGPKMGIDYISPFQKGLFSYTMPIYARWSQDDNEYTTRIYMYPELDKFTHASSTVLMQDLTGRTSESNYNGWADQYVDRFSSPHGGKGNYSFCDGHVELLSETEFMDMRDYAYHPYMNRSEVENRVNN